MEIKKLFLFIIFFFFGMVVFWGLWICFLGIVVVSFFFGIYLKGMKMKRSFRKNIVCYIVYEKFLELVVNVDFEGVKV